jgi:hypothetical protein
MATCSTSVYPPAVIASVQRQVRQARLAGRGRGGGHDGDNVDGPPRAALLPPALTPRPSLAEGRFRDSIVRNISGGGSSSSSEGER